MKKLIALAASLIFLGGCSTTHVMTGGPGGWTTVRTKAPFCCPVRVEVEEHGTRPMTRATVESPSED